MFTSQEDANRYRQRIRQVANTILHSGAIKPEILLILGSGLGGLADQVEDPVILHYDSIPDFPTATAPGHAGRLLIGKWSGHQIAVMQGRFHHYEGLAMEDVVLPIRVMQQLGVKRLLLTNAAGGIRKEMKPGNLMLIRDHISLWAESPLRGMNLDEFGPRFPDQSQVYDRNWGDQAVQCAQELGMTLHEGVYACMRGPQYETPAEIRMLRLIGASAVGMSTVPEAIVAAHGGMKVLALSCITNMAAGMLDQPLNHLEVLEVGLQAADQTIALLSAILNRLEKE